MSRDVDQIYQTNPAFGLEGTDLIYIGRYPYGTSNDMAVQWSVIESLITTGFPWNTITAASTILQPNNGYIINRPSLVMLSLPVLSNVGDLIEITSINSGGFQIAQNDGQNIRFGNQVTSTGDAGYITSMSIGDTLTLRCVIANTFWQIFASMGNLSFA